MKKKILLFGFDTLPEILPLAAAVKSFGAEVIPVAPADYRKSLAELAGLRQGGSVQSNSCLPLGGRMLVLCGLDRQLDHILDALSKAGAGPACLKAVLTPTNQDWNPLTLYAALRREQQQIGSSTRGTSPP